MEPRSPYPRIQKIIEVASVACGRGIGTQVTRRNADRHPGQRLFASSEEGDRFWAPENGSRSTIRGLALLAARFSSCHCTT